MPRQQHTAYIGIGSNLANPEQQVAQAVEGLSTLGELVSLSPLYRSTAIGPSGQPDYINAVAKLYTHFSAEQLLGQLQSLENRQNRVRDIRWGPRTIDLDILLFDDITQQTNQLTIPHSQMCQRNFVIFPLLDIAPDLVMPDGKSLVEIKSQLSADGLRRIT